MGCGCKNSKIKKIRPRIKSNKKIRPQHKTQY